MGKYLKFNTPALSQATELEPEYGIENCVGDAIGDLIGMAFGHRFRGEIPGSHTEQYKSQV